jgi:hypothetical protein
MRVCEPAEWKVPRALGSQACMRVCEPAEWAVAGSGETVELACQVEVLGCECVLGVG